MQGSLPVASARPMMQGTSHVSDTAIVSTNAVVRLLSQMLFSKAVTAKGCQNRLENISRLLSSEGDLVEEKWRTISRQGTCIISFVTMNETATLSSALQLFICFAFLYSFFRPVLISKFRKLLAQTRPDVFLEQIFTRQREFQVYRRRSLNLQIVGSVGVQKIMYVTDSERVWELFKILL